VSAGESHSAARCARGSVIALALRRRRGAPVSAEELAARLGLEPGDVCRAIEDLSERGFRVVAHPIQGYRLVEVPAALDADEIGAGLGVRRVGRRVRCVEAVTSTNDVAWEAIESRAVEADGLAVFAEYQTAGRGRRGNRWLAPPHEAILCSVALVGAEAALKAALLTRAAAVAAAEAVEMETEFARPRSVGIKWPNDVVVDGRKVGGILVEARPPGPAGPSVVIGIGLNCSQRDQAFPRAIRPRVASLAMMDGALDRTLLARRLLERLDRGIALTDSPEGAEEICRKAARRCSTLGCRITVAEGEATFTGDVIGLDPDYGLVLRLTNGAIRRFAAMTTSVVATGGRGG
jgi:BirA family biotin operon repressor/biotin-[acetyl-CoA-carboxylase] ligase